MLHCRQFFVIHFNLAQQLIRYFLACLPGADNLQAQPLGWINKIPFFSWLYNITTKYFFFLEGLIKSLNLNY